MPRAKVAASRPRYILEPGVLIYDSLRQAAGLDQVSPEARDTYRIILGFAWVNKYQFTPPITRRTIADEMGGVDESTVTRHINELVANGYLSVQPGNGQANTYVPLITYQSSTTQQPTDAQTNTANHSPALKADNKTQPYTAAHSHSPALKADAETQTNTSGEPLARMQGVGGMLNNNSSCSCSDTLKFNPDSQQQLLVNILCDHGVFPDSAQEMIAGTPVNVILDWLHALLDDDGVRDVARVLVANVLRDQRPPPRGPRSGSSAERERIRREIGWGLRPAPAPVPEPPDPEPLEPKSAAPISAEMAQAERDWQAALGEIQLQLTGATFNTWLARARLVSCDEGVFVIGVHNGYAKDWLEHRLHAMIVRALSSITGQPAEVRFVVYAEKVRVS